MTSNGMLDELLDYWIELLSAGSTALEAGTVVAQEAPSLTYTFPIAVQSAIAECFYPSGPPHRCALCVSEVSGNGPRDIHSVISRSASGKALLTGHKSFVTLGSAATRLLVAARIEVSGSADAEYVIAVVSPTADGVRRNLLSTNHAPAVLPHFEYFFHEVLVDNILPGDAFRHYLRSFRIIEDIYLHMLACVHAAEHASRYGLSAPLRNELATVATDLSSQLHTDLLSQYSVLVCEGHFSRSDALLAEAGTSLPTRMAQHDWLEGLRLVQVGMKARQARLDRAKLQVEATFRRD